MTTGNYIEKGTQVIQEAGKHDEFHSFLRHDLARFTGNTDLKKGEDAADTLGIYINEMVSHGELLDSGRQQEAESKIQEFSQNYLDPDIAEKIHG